MEKRVAVIYTRKDTGTLKHASYHRNEQAFKEWLERHKHLGIIILEKTTGGERLVKWK